MTLQNGLVHGQKAYLWCDSAFFDGQTSELLGMDAKGFTGLYWPFAGVLSSIGGNPQEIAVDIGNSWPTDVPSLLTSATEALRRYAAKGYIARILLATFEERPQLWLIGTDDCAGEGAFVAGELLYYSNAGQGLPELKEAEAKGMNPNRMRRLIDAQLQAEVTMTGSYGESGGLVQYGGNIVEFTVSRSGVDSKVLCSVEAKAA